MKTTISSVTAEMLSKFKFNRGDVLSNDIDKFKRKRKLERALERYPGEPSKTARIIFRCKSGIKKVEGEIINLANGIITLEGMKRLPVRSIIGLDLQG